MESGIIHGPYRWGGRNFLVRFVGFLVGFTVSAGEYCCGVKGSARGVGVLYVNINKTNAGMVGHVGSVNVPGTRFLAFKKCHCSCDRPRVPRCGLVRIGRVSDLPGNSKPGMFRELTGGITSSVGRILLYRLGSHGLRGREIWVLNDYVTATILSFCRL